MRFDFCSERFGPCSQSGFGTAVFGKKGCRDPTREGANVEDKGFGGFGLGRARDHAG